tara:strand:- start:1347 stop:2360 length:1014 start_codon:yes stop_codon:yes gene_type:complete
MPLFKVKKIAGRRMYHAIGSFQGVRVRHTLGTEDYLHAKDECTKFEAGVLSGAIKLGAKSTHGAQNKFKSVARRYLKSPHTGNSKSTKEYVSRLVDYFGEYQINKIDENDIEEYVEEKHVNRGNSNSTIRRDLNQLQGVLNYAAKLKLRDEIKINKPREGKHKTDTLSHEEVDLIFPELHPDVRRLCTFLLYTGARPIEAMQLRYENIDFSNSSCILGSYKGAGGELRERRVPLSDKALATIPRSDPPPHEFAFLLEGKIFETNKQIGYHWRKVTDKHNIKKSPYALRHTFATRLARNGTPPKVIADLLGHSDLKMVMRYMNTTYEDHKAAVMSLCA